MSFSFPPPPSHLPSMNFTLLIIPPTTSCFIPPSYLLELAGKDVFIPIPKKGNAKECSNYHMIALISHTTKVLLKILQARFQQYMNCELPDAQAGFRKGRGTRDQIANICWIIKRAREFQKNISFCFIDYAKAFVWITTNWNS